jgi:hypothetical protein
VHGGLNRHTTEDFFGLGWAGLGTLILLTKDSGNSEKFGFQHWAIPLIETTSGAEPSEATRPAALMFLEPFSSLPLPLPDCPTVGDRVNGSQSRSISLPLLAWFPDQARSLTKQWNATNPLTSVRHPVLCGVLQCPFGVWLPCMKTTEDPKMAQSARARNLSTPAPTIRRSKSLYFPLLHDPTHGRCHVVKYISS